MTDNRAEPVATAPPPAITGNIRAELARRGMSVERARELTGRASVTGAWRPMSASTWEERMRTPGTWRWSELTRLAAALGVDPADLVRGA